MHQLQNQEQSIRFHGGQVLAIANDNLGNADLGRDNLGGPTSLQRANLGGAVLNGARRSGATTFSNILTTTLVMAATCCS